MPGKQVFDALSRSEWAEPVLYDGPAKRLGELALTDFAAIFNGTAEDAGLIRDTAAALYPSLARQSVSCRVVHLSSMTVYGDVNVTVDETSPCRPDLGAYSAAQVAAEKIALEHANTVVLRPGCEYGPECRPWSERIARLLQSHRLGDLGPSGDGFCNLLFIGDLVKAVVTALRLPEIRGMCFNLAAPPSTWNDYLVEYALALGAVPVRRISQQRLAFESKLAAPLLKAAELAATRMGKAFELPAPITPSFLHLCGQRIVLDVSAAERTLGMTWTPRTYGLEAAGNRYRRPRRLVER